MNFLMILVACLGALNLLGLVYVLRQVEKTKEMYALVNGDLFEYSNELFSESRRIDELEEMFENSKKSQPARNPQGFKNSEMFIKSSLFKLNAEKEGTLNPQIVHDLWEDMMKRSRWWKKPDQG